MISTLLKSLKQPFSFTYPCPRKLREIVKMSALERQSPDRISQIWKEYHSNKSQNIAQSMPLEQFNVLRTQATKAPLFILPLKRQGGHFKLFTQWQKGSFLFTYLQDYKRKGTSAAPYFVITLFEQLALNKKLVLMRGDIINFQITRQQAEKLWKSILTVYKSPDIFDMVINFNHNTHLFNDKKYNEIFDL